MTFLVARLLCILVFNVVSVSHYVGRRTSIVSNIIPGILQEAPVPSETEVEVEHALGETLNTFRVTVFTYILT